MIGVNTLNARNTMKEKIEWLNRKYGGSKYAILSHGLELSVNYPLTSGELFKAYVNGMMIGNVFKTQEEAMRKCEEIAIECIKDWFKRFVPINKNKRIKGE